VRRAWLPFAAALAIAAVALAPRLFLAWAIPLGAGSRDPSCAPDESHHFPAVRALAEGRPLRFPESGVPHAAYVPTAYVPQALCQALLSAAGADGWTFGRLPVVDYRFNGYWLARAGSVLAGVAGVLVLAFAAFSLTGSSAAAFLTGLAAALHPQLAFVGSYVNGDVATFLFGALLVLALARWARAGEGDRGLAGVGLGVGIVLLGKPNGYALLVPTAAWLLWAALRGRTSRRSLVRAAALALLVAGPPLAWNASRNGGDPFGSRTLTAWVRANPALKDGRTLKADPVDFVRATARSSFAVLGNNSLPLPGSWYLAAALLVGGGLAAAAVALRRAEGVWRRGAAWLLAAFVVNAALLVRMSWWVDYQPQGRYLLLPAVLVVLAALLAPAALFRGSRRWAWPAAGVLFLGGATFLACRLVLDFPFGP
jgi:4-amino-4-deoxy-L-arabinose transferase-like glycosyltransferase